MARATTAAPRDPGLVEIADWFTWFVGAHEQRLADLQLGREQQDGELAAVLALADAIRDRMTADYLGRPR